MELLLYTLQQLGKILIWKILLSVWIINWGCSRATSLIKWILRWPWELNTLQLREHMQKDERKENEENILTNLITRATIRNKCGKVRKHNQKQKTQPKCAFNQQTAFVCIVFSVLAAFWFGFVTLQLFSDCYTYVFELVDMFYICFCYLLYLEVFFCIVIFQGHQRIFAIFQIKFVVWSNVWLQAANLWPQQMKKTLGQNWLWSCCH